VSTFIDGVSPSVNPEPGGGEQAEPQRDFDRDEDGTDSGSAWLQEEIQRRIAAGRRASKGRHARHEVASSTASISYVPRHSTATPGPGSLPPAPLATPARGIPRVPAAWSDPDDGAGGPAGGQGNAGPAPTTGAGAAGGAAEHAATTAATTAAAPPEEDPATRGHRRTILGGGVAVVSVDAPSPWRSGDPLPAASVRKARELAEPPPAAEEAADRTESLQSKRVRVVLSERKGGARPVRTVVDIQENTGVGELLRSNLIRSQLGVAMRCALLAAGTLAVLPVLFWLFPAIGRTEVFGLRVPWLLLGFLVYPFLLAIGLWHTRAAERVEQNFADHVQD
jgi:hypothetical protein